MSADFSYIAAVFFPHRYTPDNYKSQDDQRVALLVISGP